MTLTRNSHSFATLRRFARTPVEAVRQDTSVESCDFCSIALATRHQHLIEPEQRHLVCVCEACAVLFDTEGETKYRRVPRRIRFLPVFHLSEAQWQSLQIPIQLVFIFQSSVAKQVIALYPSPAGPTESWLDPAAWEGLVAANPLLKKLQPDVEALLINRVREAGSAKSAHAYFIAPIDECFKLTGLLRIHWRGLSGGTKVWEEIAQFFADLQTRAVVRGEGASA